MTSTGHWILGASLWLGKMSKAAGQRRQPGFSTRMPAGGRGAQRHDFQQGSQASIAIRVVHLSEGAPAARTGSLGRCATVRAQVQACRRGPCAGLAVLRCCGGMAQQEGSPERNGACSTTPPSCGSCAARWQVGPDPTAHVTAGRHGVKGFSTAALKPLQLAYGLLTALPWLKTATRAGYPRRTYKSRSGPGAGCRTRLPVQHSVLWPLAQLLREVGEGRRDV